MRHEHREAVLGGGAHHAHLATAGQERLREAEYSSSSRVASGVRLIIVGCSKLSPKKMLAACVLVLYTMYFKKDFCLRRDLTS